jgi:hypothetical protein
MLPSTEGYTGGYDAINIRLLTLNIFSRIWINVDFITPTNCTIPIFVPPGLLFLIWLGSLLLLFFIFIVCGLSLP